MSINYHFHCEYCDADFSDEFDLSPEAENDLADGDHLRFSTDCDCPKSKNKRPMVTGVGRSYTPKGNQ